MKSAIVGVLLLVLCPVIVLAQSLEGAWMADVVVIGGGPDAGRHSSDLQPGLAFFSKSHYSFMWIRGYEERAPWADENNPTDAEILAAHRAFGANAGKYSLDGSTITFDTKVARNPVRMVDNKWSMELEWDGDAFWIISDAGDWKNRTHFVRVD